MGEHLDDGAGDADLVERHEAEQDEAHVADAGVADDELEVFLDEGDQGAIDDADDGEESEDVAPGAEAEDVVAPGREAEREEGHGNAEAAVGTELHDDAGEQHGGCGGRGDVSGGRPGVEGPQAGEDGKAYEDEREGEHLEVRRERVAGQVAERHGARTGDDIGGDESDEDHGGADEGVDGKLHGAVFAAGRAPDGDEEVLGDDDDLVEDEEEEEVVAEEDSVDGADEQEVEGEELFGAILNVPGEEDAGDGDDAGEEDEGEADAVRCEVIADSEGGNPGGVGYGEHLPGAVVHKGAERDGEPGGCREQREDARQGYGAFGQQEHGRRAEKRDVDCPSKHIQNTTKDLSIKT